MHPLFTLHFPDLPPAPYHGIILYIVFVPDFRYNCPVNRYISGLIVALSGMLATVPAYGQIDPDHRELIQLGYNQPLLGRGPISGYAFYYRNQPEFLHTNYTLRLAVAPVYLDSELGIRDALGEHTDLGIGVAGGGFAQSYFEMRQGRYLREESFTGHGAEPSVSVYHLFNPTQMIPLHGLLRVNPRYTVYERNDETAPNFVIPPDHGSMHLRAGLRYGGEEPVMNPDVAMELSGWYEAQFREHAGPYGYNDDRAMNSVVHLFWARALFVYTLPESKQSFGLSVTVGGSLHNDRLSAYRLGGDLPLSAEFPLILPGYYFQEISAREFVNLTAQYSVPIDPSKQFRLTGIGSLAEVDYLPTLSQKEHLHSGAGLGLEYRSRSGVWSLLVGYGYGFNATRSDGRSGQNIGVLCQIDLEAHHRAGPWFQEGASSISHGLFHYMQQWF